MRIKTNVRVPHDSNKTSPAGKPIAQQNIAKKHNRLAIAGLDCLTLRSGNDEGTGLDMTLKR